MYSGGLHKNLLSFGAKFHEYRYCVALVLLINNQFCFACVLHLFSRGCRMFFMRIRHTTRFLPRCCAGQESRTTEIITEHTDSIKRGCCKIKIFRPRWSPRSPHREKRNNSIETSLPARTRSFKLPNKMQSYIKVVFIHALYLPGNQRRWHGSTYRNN